MTTPVRESGRIRIALGEYDTGWHDPMTSLARAEGVVREAASAGASLVALPEMCTTGFTMDTSVQPRGLDDAQVAGLATLARTYGVHLIAGTGMRERDGAAAACSNSALVFAPDGTLLAQYRKQRLFAFAGEDACYQAGAEPVVVDVDGVRVAPLICFDLRFPELFQSVASEVDAFVVIANWPHTRRGHWDALTQARAIETQSYLIAVNRVGDADGLSYDGGSVAFGPMGDRVDRDADTPSGLRIADVTAADVRAVRARFPFYPGRT